MFVCAPVSTDIHSFLACRQIVNAMEANHVDGINDSDDEDGNGDEDGNDDDKGDGDDVDHRFQSFDKFSNLPDLSS